MEPRAPERPTTAHNIVILLLLLAFALILAAQPPQQQWAAASSPTQPAPPKLVANSTTAYLPLIVQNYPWLSPFGVESTRSFLPGSTELERVRMLSTSWVRLGNRRISWVELQPTEGGAINWGLLADFEEELTTLKAAHITPVIVVIDSPRWATIEPTLCGAIRTDKFAAFADFMRQLVERYSAPAFDVHHWELGNEPDLAPSLVPEDYGFGCWGDIADPYYGGEQYGEMLKVVTPAMRTADPDVKIWIGGLLLNSPNSEETNPGAGRPELFLQGILETGAAPHFDIVAYHLYPPYLNTKRDHDNDIWSPWNTWGGGILGKARFLRDIMQQYGVSKPVFLNETGFMCAETVAGEPAEWCVPPGDAFFEMQADFAVRTFVRGMSEDVMGFIWYTLNGPGWRHTGMFNSDQTPRPVYTAYQTLNNQLKGTTYAAPAEHGIWVEGYIFTSRTRLVQVLWSRNDATHVVSIPAETFIAAYDRENNPITPTLSGNYYQLQVQFAPIYVLLHP